MRELSTAAANWITQPVGIESVMILVISWTDGVWNYYADTNYGELTAAGLSPELGIDGEILELSNLESLPDLDGKASSQSLHAVLDDTRGDLKRIIDTVDIHKRPVKVAQWFKGIPLADAFVLFEGQITSPIVWNEGERKLEFDIMSILESREVGYSIEEGDFDYAPPNLIGKAWPYIFGTCFKVPAIRIQDIPRGVTSRSFRDSTRTRSSSNSNISAANSNIRAMNEALMRAEECFAHATEIRLAIGRFSTIVTTSGIPITTLSHTYTLNVREFVEENVSQTFIKTFTISGTKEDYENAVDEYFRRGNDYLLQAQAAGQASFTVSSGGDTDNTIDVANGNEFPQNVPLTAVLQGRTYKGTFSGRTFHINGLSEQSFSGVAGASRVVVSDNYVSTQYLQQVDGAQTFVVSGGARISIGNGSGFGVDYIACLDHCSVLGVYARRTFGDATLLWPVPGNYYSVVYEDYGPNLGTGNPYDNIKVTKIVMSTPLSSRTNDAGESEGWDDDIYCDLSSPYGNNAVVHMKILIQRYTNVGWDATSFDFVETIQNNYPVGGALISRKDVLTVLKEMAFQMRCNIRYNNGKFYLKYLSLNYPFVGTITNADIERASLQITCVETEDLVTKLVARWNPDLSGENQRTAIYRHNINKYGTHEEQFDFWLYNIESTVHKSAVFWMVRKANTYKRLKFNTFLTKMALEANDYVQVTVSDSHDGTVIGMVESCIYDSATGSVSMELWLPVRMGERLEYIYAMPADLPATTQFPSQRSIARGQAGTGSRASGRVVTQGTGYYGSSGARTPHLDQGRNFDGFGGLVPPDNNYGISDVGNQPQNYQPGLNPGDISRTINTQTTPPIDVKVFQIKPVPPPNINRQSANTIFPGRVISQEFGNIYNVNAYINGLDNEPVVILAEQIDINAEDTLDTETPVIVFQMQILEGDSTVVKYYMQAPVWSGPPEEEV